MRRSGANRTVERVGTLLENPVMIALATYRPREGAADVLVDLQPCHQSTEIMPGPPAELFARLRIHVDAVERGEHAPSLSRVECGLLGEEPHDDTRRVGAEKGAPEACWTGVAVDVQGGVQDVVLRRNVLRETRGPARRTGIRIGPRVGAVELADNRVMGFATILADQRKKAR